MRLFRLFNLLDQLRVRTTPVTARELSHAMDVSIRSVYRDLADLQAMGAPIRGEGGIGYVMDRGYFLPSLSFDNDELEALSLGLKFAAERSSKGIAVAARRATAKITSAIGEGARNGFLESTLETAPSPVGERTRKLPLYDELRTTIRTRQVLAIDYLSGNGRRTTRLARPLGLTAFEENWLLTIWCETAQNFRHLRLDRITKFNRTGETFRDDRGKRFLDAMAVEKSKLTSEA